MTTELGILGLYGIFVILTIFAQAQAGMAQLGLATLMKPRDDLPKLTGIAGRLDRAQANSITAMALFAPAVLILAHQNISTPTTLGAAQLFLVARVLYVPLYAFGIPGLRTLVWTVGILCTLWLYVAALI
jgi:uncharacterized MAPEG superfamily protein